MEAFFHVRYKEILVSRKMRTLSYGNLPQTLDFESFATACRSCCQQNSSTVELVDDTYRVCKKRGHRLMTIILSILNRFKIFSLEDSLANLQLHEY